jgi:hypothetical protein
LSRDHLFLLWRYYGKSSNWSSLPSTLIQTFLHEFFSAWKVELHPDSTLLISIEHSLPPPREVGDPFHRFSLLFKEALVHILEHPERSAVLRHWQRQVELTPSLHARLYSIYEQPDSPIPPFIPWIATTVSQSATSPSFATSSASTSSSSSWIYSPVPLPAPLPPPLPSLASIFSTSFSIEQYQETCGELRVLPMDLVSFLILPFLFPNDACALIQTCKALYLLTHWYHPSFVSKKVTYLNGSVPEVVKYLHQPPYKALTSLKIEVDGEFTVSQVDTLLSSIPPHLTRLDIYLSSVKPLSFGFRTSSPPCTSLKHLAIVSNFLPELLQPFSSCFPSIRTLKFETSSGLYTTLNDLNGMRHLLNNLHSLDLRCVHQGRMQLLEAKSGKEAHQAFQKTGSLLPLKKLKLEYHPFDIIQTRLAEEAVDTLQKFNSGTDTLRDIQFFSVNFLFAWKVLKRFAARNRFSSSKLERLWIHFNHRDKRVVKLERPHQKINSGGWGLFVYDHSNRNMDKHTSNGAAIQRKLQKLRSPKAFLERLIDFVEGSLEYMPCAIDFAFGATPKKNRKFLGSSFSSHFSSSSSSLINSKTEKEDKEYTMTTTTTKTPTVEDVITHEHSLDDFDIETQQILRGTIIHNLLVSNEEYVTRRLFAIIHKMPSLKRLTFFFHTMERS